MEGATSGAALKTKGSCDKAKTEDDGAVRTLQRAYLYAVASLSAADRGKHPGREGGEERAGSTYACVRF